MVEQQIPLESQAAIQAILGRAEYVPLDTNQPLDRQQTLLQKTLRTVFDLCSLFESAPAISLTVPSNRLVHLRLVSEETAREIQERERRKPGEVVNRVVIQPIREEATQRLVGFRVTETYVQELASNDSGRLDAVTEERTELIREGDNLSLTIDQKQSGHHFHPSMSNTTLGFGERWVPETPLQTEYQKLALNPRCVNTTVALLVEALSPGSFSQFTESPYLPG